MIFRVNSWKVLAFDCGVSGEESEAASDSIARIVDVLLATANCEFVDYRSLIVDCRILTLQPVDFGLLASEFSPETPPVKCKNFPRNNTKYHEQVLGAYWCGFVDRLLFKQSFCFSQPPIRRSNADSRLLNSDYLNSRIYLEISGIARDPS